jgi:hypothetical protein
VSKVFVDVRPWSPYSRGQGLSAGDRKARVSCPRYDGGGLDRALPTLVTRLWSPDRGLFSSVACAWPIFWPTYDATNCVTISDAIPLPPQPFTRSRSRRQAPNTGATRNGRWRRYPSTGNGIPAMRVTA